MQNRRIWSIKFTNWLHTGVLLAALVGLMALIGYAFGGSTGVLWAVLLGAALLLFSRQLPTVLTMRMLRARPLNHTQAPDLIALVEMLTRRAGLARTPTVYLLPSSVPNAFATGSGNDTALGVTFGLLQALSQRELAGVLAHEISHIRHNDLRVMMLATVVGRATAILARAGQFLLILNLPLLLLGQATVSWLAIALLLSAPTLSGLLQLALSRRREFNADIGAVQLTNDPYGLASALDKLERRPGGWLGRLLGWPSAIVPTALRSHPHTPERIARLMTLVPPSSRPSAPLPVTYI